MIIHVELNYHKSIQLFQKPGRYLITLCISVETNIYFGTNWISNIICLMKIERIEHRILFAHQENIRILFKYLKIFEYIQINLGKNVKVLESKIFIYPKNTFWSERIFHMLTLINKNYRSLLTEYCSNFVSVSRIIFGCWKSPWIEYEYQYSWGNIQINLNIRCNTAKVEVFTQAQTLKLLSQKS